jgi:integrase
MAVIEKRTLDTGETSYRVKIRLKGFPPETATFQRLTDAKAWAQRTEADIREGRYFRVSHAKKRTLADAIEKYDAEVLAHKGGAIQNQQHYLEWWQAHIGCMILADIVPSVITETRKKLIGSKNAYGRVINQATANRYTTALGHLFTVAVNEWQWLHDNPIRRIKKFKESRGRVRFLDAAERERLLRACQDSTNPQLYTIVVLALTTGARKNEILFLRWQDVDLQRERIILHHTKNGERRTLPVKGLGLQLLRAHARQRQPHSDFVFPGSVAGKPVDIRTAWESAVKKAELVDFRFHDLRHTTASYLAMNSASLPEISEVLGHKTLQMVRRYAHLSEQHTAGVLERTMNSVFGG